MSTAPTCVVRAAVVIAMTSVGIAQVASPPAIRAPHIPVQTQTAIVEPLAPSLTITFQGGDVPENASKVLHILEREKLLEIRTATIPKGKSLCDVYLELMAFPMGCTSQLVRLANDLNGLNYTQRTLRIGDAVEYPDVYFMQRTFTKRFDPKVPEHQKALEDIHKNWSAYILKEDTLPTGLVRVDLKGYELKVPISSPLDAQRAVSELAKARIPNITFTHPDEQKRLLKYHSTPIPPTKYLNDCRARILPAGEQCAYSLLVGLDKLDYTTCTTRCPDVFLVDKPVRRNPALKNAVRNGYGVDPDPAPAVDLCALSDLKDGDHGTHLAAIIGSAGPVCVGVYPNVQLYSWNREAPENETRDDIERVQSNFENNIETVGLPIFVFANSWEFSGKRGQLGERLAAINEPCTYPPCARFRKPLADEIGNNQGALWVVASGQADPTRNEQPVEITADLALGPMNLGDLPNVLVVTACVDCASAEPRLRPAVNYSSSLVHLAAPGDDIPGPAGENRLGIGGGTSQAVAFATGVASAMVAKYPASFVKPEAVKTRLQITSRPVLTGTDATHLATGVIDPAVALKPPSKDYYQPIGGSLTEATIENWCVPQVQLSDPSTLRPLGNPVRVRDIFRIYRVNRDDANGQPQWMFYTKQPWSKRPGEVIRMGPAVFNLPGPRSGQAGSLFKVKGVASGISAGRFLDLLLHDAAGIKVDSCG
jgi:hypothetical protein